MNHGSPVLDHRSAPVPPPPVPSYPGEPRQADPLTLPAFDPVAAPVPHRGRPWVHLVLFLATIASTTLVGAEHYRSFVADYGSPSDVPYVLWRGLWYSATISFVIFSPSWLLQVNTVELLKSIRRSC